LGLPCLCAVIWTPAGPADITESIIRGHDGWGLHEAGWIEASLSPFQCPQYTRVIKTYADSIDWQEASPTTDDRMYGD
jgi:hypothetical protein